MKELVYHEEARNPLSYHNLSVEHQNLAENKKFVPPSQIMTHLNDFHIYYNYASNVYVLTTSHEVVALLTR